MMAWAATGSSVMLLQGMQRCSCRLIQDQDFFDVWLGQRWRAVAENVQVDVQLGPVGVAAPIVQVLSVVSRGHVMQDRGAIERNDMCVDHESGRRRRTENRLGERSVLLAVFDQTRIRSAGRRALGDL